MKLNILFTKLLYQITTISRKKYNESYPDDKDVEIFKDVKYTNNNDKKQKLDIYTKDTKGNYPVFVQIHGGGWTLGDKADNIGYCRYIASKGYVSVAINYTLAPKAAHPEQEKIVLEAFQWINDNIKKYGGDSKKIFISGDSGGAHLASVVANVCTNDEAMKIFNVKPPLKKEQIAGMVLFYGAYDFMKAKYADFPFIKVSYESFLGTMDIENNKKLMTEASPLYFVSKDFPRSILISGEVDGLHETQTKSFINKLEENAVPYEKVIFDRTRKDAAHGFMVDYSRECTKESIDKVLAFLSNKKRDVEKII